MRISHSTDCLEKYQVVGKSAKNVQFQLNLAESVPFLRAELFCVKNVHRLSTKRDWRRNTQQVHVKVGHTSTSYLHVRLNQPGSGGL